MNRIKAVIAKVSKLSLTTFRICGAFLCAVKNVFFKYSFHFWHDFLYLEKCKIRGKAQHGELYFHTPEIFINEQYILKYFIAFNSCLIKFKLACSKVINILISCFLNVAIKILLFFSIDFSTFFKESMIRNSKNNTITI